MTKILKNRIKAQFQGTQKYFIWFYFFSDIIIQVISLFHLFQNFTTIFAKFGIRHMFTAATR